MVAGRGRFAVIYENREGWHDWDIRPGWWRSRAPGLSAMLRLKNEAMWIGAALRSIAGWCDELVIVLQGEQDDGTERAVQDWLLTFRPLDLEVRIFRYPFDSRPNGPGHGAQPRGSVHERAYFYNWCLALTSRSHVVKWDGDMVALDGTGREIRAALKAGADYIRFAGHEIAALDPLRLSRLHPVANAECRIFPALRRHFYETRDLCEGLTNLPEVSDQLSLPSPAYLHFKWTKPENSITAAWPKNWRRQDHFRALAARAEPGDCYEGPVPAVLSA